MRLDLTPAEADNETGSLHLHGASLGYDKTIVIAGHYETNPNVNTVDIEFDDVPTKDTYTLSYIGSDGTEVQLVDGAHFSSLQDDSLPPEPTGAPTPAPGQ